jgi:hypothetical protein
MGIFSKTEVDASFNLKFKHAEDMMKHEVLQRFVEADQNVLLGLINTKKEDLSNVEPDFEKMPGI